MSTSYLSREPMTLADFEAKAKSLGWNHVGYSDKDQQMWCSPESYYAHVSAFGPYVCLMRYGGNVVEDLVEEIGMLSEYEPEFDEICAIVEGV